MIQKHKITLDDYTVQKKLLEGSIKLAIEKAIQAFQTNTDYCPGRITIEMLDASKQNLAQGAYKWQDKKRFDVGRVRACIEM